MNEQIRKAAEEVKRLREKGAIPKGDMHMREWEERSQALSQAEKLLCTLVIEYLESEGQA